MIREDKKISQLQQTESLQTGDLLTLVQSLKNKSIEWDDMIQQIINDVVENTALKTLPEDLQAIRDGITAAITTLTAAIESGDQTTYNNALRDAKSYTDSQITVVNTHILSIDNSITSILSQISGILAQMPAYLTADDLTPINDRIDALEAKIDVIPLTPITPNYTITIYASTDATTTPQRPTFDIIPVSGGTPNPGDNIVWYYQDYPTTGNIWVATGLIDGSTNKPISRNGYYWSSPVKITSNDANSAYVTPVAFTIPANANGATTSANRAKVVSYFSLKKGNLTLAYNTDYTIQLIQPDSTNTSTFYINESDNTIRLQTLDNTKDITILNVIFYIDGEIVEQISLSVSKSLAAVSPDYQYTIYAYSTTQPQTPTFSTPPTPAGAAGPDGVLWYPSTPSGSPIWSSMADMSGSTGQAISGWSTPIKITGSDGTQGPQGPAGATGPQGPAGAQGNPAVNNVALYRRSNTKPYTPQGIHLAYDPVGTSSYQRNLVLLDGYNNYGSNGRPANGSGIIDADLDAHTNCSFQSSSQVDKWYLDPNKCPGTAQLWVIYITGVKFMTGTIQDSNAQIRCYKNFSATTIYDTTLFGITEPVEATLGSAGSSSVVIYSVGNVKPTTPTFTTMPSSGGSSSGGFTWYPESQNGAPQWASFGSLAPTGATSNWSNPFKITGADGSVGATEPFYLFQGIYDSNKYYVTNDQYTDIVKYNGSYYFRTPGTNASVRGVAPTDTTQWTLFQGNFDTLATNLFFANTAAIAGWQMNQDYIASQNGNVFLDGRTYSQSGGTGVYPISIGPNATSNPSGGLFKVDHNGNMFAQGADINGVISAERIGLNYYQLGTNTIPTGWSLTNPSLYESVYQFTDNSLSTSRKYNVYIEQFAASRSGGPTYIVLPQNLAFLGVEVNIMLFRDPQYTDYWPIYITDFDSYTYFRSHSNTWPNQTQQPYSGILRTKVDTSQAGNYYSSINAGPGVYKLQMITNGSYYSGGRWVITSDFTL